MKKIKVLGIEYYDFTIESINDFVVNQISNGKKEFILNHNLHSVFLFHQNEEFKEVYRNHKYVHADGMPLVFWAKLMGFKVSRSNRITYVDWIYPLLERANQNSYKIFYLGGKADTGQKAIERLRPKFPNISFKFRNGYFDVDNMIENQEILDEISAFKPQILLVGMGMPRQELWVDKNMNHIDANIILASGACFDYIAGEVRTPPRWLSRLGLEWLHRLIFEPKRLFSRYLIEPIYLVPFFIKDFIRVKK